MSTWLIGWDHILESLTLHHHHQLLHVLYNSSLGLLHCCKDATKHNWYCNNDAILLHYQQTVAGAHFTFSTVTFASDTACIKQRSSVHLLQEQLHMPALFGTHSDRHNVETKL